MTRHIAEKAFTHLRQEIDIRKGNLALIAGIVLVIQLSTASGSGIEWRQVTPALSDAVLFNPSMGLYMAGGSGLGYKPEPDAWVLSLCDIVYFRPTWNDLEEVGPGTGLDAYFEPIFDFWVRQRGKRVAFRVMSESTHYRGKYATPKWVFDQGVPSVLHRGLRGQEQIDPIFWNPLYLKLHCEFIQRMGHYLNGRPGLEYVDIGGIGEWGEMHLGLHMPGRWTPKQLEQTGFTREKYIAAYRRVIDAHAEAFPNTRVFLNIGSYPEINDYAALRGCHFRQDGLTPRGPSANVGKLYYHSYSRRGVICNYEFHSSYRSMLEKGWGLRETVEQGLSDPISYLNTNILTPQAWEKAPTEVKKLFLDAAKKIGFRFVITQLRTPTKLNLSDRMPGRLLIEHTWKNIGVAPCHESYALEFTLHNSSGKIIAPQQHFPVRPTTQWFPNEETIERTLIRFPAGLPDGEYELKVAMQLPEKAGHNILLGLAGRDEADRYSLCRLAGVTVQRPTGIIHEQSFESPKHDWNSSRGIQLERDTTIFQDGKASLHLSGRQTQGWNYVSHSLDSPILPASKYRLTCWLKVNTMEPAHSPPYLKIGLADAEGKWLTNCSTNSYDMSHPGTWQRLEATFETSLETAGGHLALERGSNDMATHIDLWLDNVQLELLEAP
ncbi:MAG: DUF4832 domain-containing protein [Sedimentisphaerales bacterium]|nr:DUF4832 domain-containing protein [Sedimentisphaerales bacterium]